jgi:hypothetical protein
MFRVGVCSVCIFGSSERSAKLEISNAFLGLGWSTMHSISSFFPKFTITKRKVAQGICLS